MAFLIGVDGGGTSCRAVIAARDGTRLGEGLAGSANIMTDLNTARDNILQAAGLAARQAGLPESWMSESAAVLGLAGANIGNNSSRIVSLLPFVSITSKPTRGSRSTVPWGNRWRCSIVGTGSVFMSQNLRSDTPIVDGDLRSVIFAARTVGPDALQDVLGL